MKLLSDFLHRNPDLQVENIPLSLSKSNVPIFCRRFSHRSLSIKKHKLKPQRVFVIHGLGEYHLRQLDLIQFLLCEKDLNVHEVIAYDHAGHGLSGGVSNYIEHFDAFSDDLFELIKYFSKDDGHLNLVMAHSMGGLVLLNLIRLYYDVYREYIDQIVLSAPCVRSKIPYIKKLIDLYDDNQDSLPLGMKKLILPVIYNGLDITNNLVKADEFDQDPYIKPFTSLHLGIEILKTTEKIKEVPYLIKVPCLFLVPEDDVLVDPKAAKLFAQSIDNDFVSLISYNEMKHDLFNENESELVFNDLKKWILVS